MNWTDLFPFAERFDERAKDILDSLASVHLLPEGKNASVLRWQWLWTARKAGLITHPEYWLIVNQYQGLKFVYKSGGLQ